MKKRWISKSTVAAIACVTLLSGVLAGCGSEGGQSDQADGAGDFKQNKAITVVSREDGSGTRGAFIELFGLEEKQADGSKVDHTTKEAMIANKTDVVLTQVSGSAYAIGYVSLGSLNDTVKALKIDGAEATVANIKNGSYKASRPFMIATKKGTSNALAEDFINYIMSADGQKVVEDNKYIKVNENAPAYDGTKPSGKLTVGGSSSVTPVMEKLVEAYKAVNPNATIEVQQTDSTSGIQSALSGSVDIAMASRDLKDDEKAQMDEKKIAIDGIAVIVNKENPNSDMKAEAITKIYKGEAETWAEVMEG